MTLMLCESSASGDLQDRKQPGTFFRTASCSLLLRCGLPLLGLVRSLCLPLPGAAALILASACVMPTRKLRVAKEHTLVGFAGRTDVSRGCGIGQSCATLCSAKLAH